MVPHKKIKEIEAAVREIGLEWDGFISSRNLRGYVDDSFKFVHRVIFRVVVIAIAYLFMAEIIGWR